MKPERSIVYLTLAVFSRWRFVFRFPQRGHSPFKQPGASDTGTAPNDYRQIRLPASKLFVQQGKLEVAICAGQVCRSQHPDESYPRDEKKHKGRDQLGNAVIDVRIRHV